MQKAVEVPFSRASVLVAAMDAKVDGSAVSWVACATEQQRQGWRRIYKISSISNIFFTS